MPISELLLARHGEAVCDVHGLVGGEFGCTGLTVTGRRQAAQLANRLRIEDALRPFDALYSAPRRRCRETADIVATVLGVPAELDRELRGADPGDADARLWREVEDSFGGPPQHDPHRPYAQGAESWGQYLRRSTAALARIIANHRDQRVLIVAHDETIEAAYTLLLGLSLETCRHARYAADHTSLTRWQQQSDQYGQWAWTLCAHNDISHLSQDRQ